LLEVGGAGREACIAMGVETADGSCPHQLLRCSVVSSAEFNKICSKTAIGFVVMGFIGFFVKLIFIVSPTTL
jgi:preprotein translocase subunit Sss1